MNYRRTFLLVIVGGLWLLTMRVVTSQESTAMIEPEAGSWYTWLLDSGDQLRLDAPPDEEATAEEIDQLLAAPFLPLVGNLYPLYSSLV